VSQRLCVIVASIGRAGLLAETVANLSRQTRRPDHVLVVSVTPDDVLGVAAITALPVEVIFADKGLPIQRNAGLLHMQDKADVIAFFDDDFVPAPDYLERLDHLFSTRPEVVGATGRVIADGIKSRGISFTQSLRLIAEDIPPFTPSERKMPALYGCNLSIRTSAADGLWFDEALPLYGWQEDVDFSYQLGQRGVLLLTDTLAGVHLGTKGGRTSGRRLGYSQIANPIYLLRKRTIPPRLAWRLMLRNMSANLIKCLRPEPYVDRRGRLAGNLIAIVHLTIGRLHPTKVWNL
jgi:GT2 family glycosyltransferase